VGNLCKSSLSLVGLVVQNLHDQIGVLLESSELCLIPEGGSLDDFSHTVDNLSLGQSLEELEVNVDALGLPESTDQVLAQRSIDGSLATNGRVNHGQEGGRDLNEADTAHVCSSNEANHVANNTAAQGDNNAVSSDTLREHPVLDGGLGRSALGALTRRNLVGKKSWGIGKVGGVLFEGGFEAGCVEGANVGISDEDIGARGNILQQIGYDEVLPESVVNND